MSVNNKNLDERHLREQLQSLKLSAFLNSYNSAAKEAAEKHWALVHYLAELTEAEINLRRDHRIQRRIKMARFPVKWVE